jgi:cytoskeletal protein CcmA (bactofilin family)
MFTKKSDKESPLDLMRSAPPLPAAAPPLPATGRTAVAGRPAEKAVSIIGADLAIIGNLVSKGEVQIDGEVQGDVHGTHIVIGESAKITGGVVGDEVIVRGTVLGSIRGKRVALQSSSKVEGDVYHQTLAIEQGAYFEGKSRRSADPTASVIRPDLPTGGYNGAGSSYSGASESPTS